MSMKTLAARMQYLGGDQLARMDKQKLKSLQWALKNSHNSRKIQVGSSEWSCLINGESGGLKSDYDKKEISVEFDSGLTAGDTFRVLDNDTHWMVYLPIITETAYLRSSIIRCRYTLTINDKLYWIYFQGPTETDLRWLFKNNINANELNLSGTIYIKNDENTKPFFKRFTRLKIEGHTWEVQVTDSITVPGIIELEVQEYYDNSIEELPEIIKVDEESQIIGETTVKQDVTVGYAIADTAYDPQAEWSIKNNNRVEIEEILEDGRICKVKIHQGAIDTFDICYGDNITMSVTIDWQKPQIQGPVEVYPYDTHTYWVKGEDRKVQFRIVGNDAKIVSANNDSCQVEVTTGRSGSFTIQSLLEDGSIVELPVTVNSF